MMKYVEAELEKEGETLMGHLTTKDAYKNLEERINWFTQGAPPSETLGAVHGKRSKMGGQAPGASIYIKACGEGLGNDGGESGETAESSLRESAACRFGLPWRAPVCHAASDGRLHRVCADAYQRRY